KLLPPAHDDVAVARIDLQAITDPLRHFCRDQRRSRTKKWIVDRSTAFGVIQDRPAHQFHRFLSPVPRRAFLLVSPEGIQVGHLPERRLRAVSSPVCPSTLAHRIPARFVLPMIRSPAQGKMLFGPDNLRAYLKSGLPDPDGHFRGMHAGVPDIDHVTRKQPVSGRPVGSVVVRYGPGLPLFAETRLLPPIRT